MEVDTTTWTVGFAIAGLVVVVVVAVVLGIIALATRIRDQVGNIVAALQDAEARTDALWDVQTTLHVGHEIHDLAQQARHQLEA